MRVKWLRGLSAAGNAGVIVGCLAWTTDSLTGIWVLNEYGQPAADQVSFVAVVLGWLATAAAATLAFWWGYHRDWTADVSRGWSARLRRMGPDPNGLIETPPAASRPPLPGESGQG